MRRTVPRSFLVAAACSAVLLTAACGTSDTTAAPETATTAEVTTAPSAGQTSASPEPAGTSETSASPAGTVITISYAGGEATGDTGRIKVKVGEPITLKVTSDVKNEVHIHGADLYLDLEPGVEAVQEFTEDAPGVYEVELHDGGGVLTRVQAE